MFLERKTRIVKMSVHPNLLLYRFSAIPIKILTSYLMDINRLTIKFTSRNKRSRIANIILKDNKFGVLTLLNSRPTMKLQ